MKLLFCVSCGDVLALKGQKRSCECGQSSGRYIDQLNAEVSGPCFVLAFLNREFFGIVSEQLSRGDLEEKLVSPPYVGETKGRVFTGILVPESASSLKRLDAEPQATTARKI